MNERLNPGFDRTAKEIYLGYGLLLTAGIGVYFDNLALTVLSIGISSPLIIDGNRRLNNGG